MMHKFMFYIVGLYTVLQWNAWNFNDVFIFLSATWVLMQICILEWPRVLIHFFDAAQALRTERALANIPLPPQTQPTKAKEQ